MVQPHTTSVCFVVSVYKTQGGLLKKRDGSIYKEGWLQSERETDKQKVMEGKRWVQLYGEVLELKLG